MTVQTIEFYEVADVYSEDGRGFPTIIARITDRAEAFTYAKGKGNFGGDANVSLKRITLVDKADELEDYKREEDRLRALDKLTDKEKELLGLK